MASPAADIPRVVVLRPHSLLCALAFAASAAGQIVVDPPEGAGEAASGGERPVAAQRVVRVFGFEERYGDTIDLPDGWVRAQDDPLVPRVRPGFPIYNLARLDYRAPAHGGRGSVRCRVEGGSASLRLKAGELPIFPMGQYLVRVSYRCEGVERSRPRLVVRALDARGEPIAGSDRAAIAERVDGTWRELAVELPGKFPEAAYLQIDLEVVQPVEFEARRLGDHQVWEQDFDGVVWFDDVVVAQVPQLRLETNGALNVIARPASPALRVRLRDLAAQDMTATVRVFDADRRLVASMERAVTSGRVSWEWEPGLEELGWYRAVIDIAAGGSLVASETCDFVLVDEPRLGKRPYASGPVFAGAQTGAAPGSWRPVGIELTGPLPGEAATVASALGGLGAGSVTTPVWTADLTAESLPGRVDEIRALMGALREAWIEPRLSLPVVPEALAGPRRLGSSDVVGALSGDPEGWGPYLLDALDRLGATTARWQLGPAGSEGSFADPALAADLTAARGRMSGLVPGIELALGWRADLDAAALIGAGADAARVFVPAWSGATPAGEIVGPWRAGAGSESGVRAEFVLEPLGGAGYTERRVAADLARRAVELWASATAGSEGGSARWFGAAIADPWRVEWGEDPAAYPTVAAAAWRALADRLDGRVLAADWDMGPGVRCLVFGAPADDPERGGLIVAWRAGAPEELARLRATLGDEALRVYDLFGNSHTVAPAASEDGTRVEHDIALGEEPVFVEGVNTALVRFLAGITLDPSRIECATGEHEHAVTVSNPWDVPASGRVVIASPGAYDEARQARDRSWDIAPRTLWFDLAAGETVRLPLVVSFSRAIEAGPQRFVFDIELTADRDYGWLRARAETELVWSGVELDLTYRVPPDGGDGDVMIEAMVTNTGDAARALEAIAFAPGQTRARSTIGMLGPGESVMRRFLFAGAARALAGERVVVSVSEAGGPGRLTKAVVLPGG